MKCLPKSLKTLGRSIGRKSRTSIARQSLKDQGIRKKILGYLGKDIQHELTGLCKKSFASVFRGRSAEVLQEFSWDQVVEELKNRAPTLHTFLNGCVDVKRRERPSKKARRAKKAYRPSNSAVLGVCASILLRHKNQQMNVLQCLVSLILHRGHAGKQVCGVDKIRAMH